MSQVASAMLLNGHNSGGVDIMTDDGIPTGSWSSKNDGGGFTIVSDTVGCPHRKESQHSVEGCSSKLTGLSTHAFVMGMSGEGAARLAIDGDGSMKYGNGGAAAPFDTTFQRPISATKYFDPPPLAAGAANVSSVLVGVCDQAGSDFHHGCPAPGDVVAVSHSALGMSAVQLTAHVADTKGVVAVVLRNVGLEPLDVPAGTLRVVVYKFE
jgi:hypothetical protein